MTTRVSFAAFVAYAAFAALAAAPSLVAAAASCPAGSFSPTGQQPCAFCDPGTFQPNAGQTSCQKAQKGWFASGPHGGSGATSQSQCPQGAFSANDGQASCTICPAGSYCNDEGQTKPVPCPPGHFSPTPGAGQQCKECPKGTFVATSGATACCACCSGFYTDQTGQTHCFDCPVRGAFSPVGATSASQCGKTPGGGLTSCVQSGNKCPNTGSSPTGIHGRRDIKRRACPAGHKSCPVYGSTSGRGFLKAYECVDVQNDLESCGGCVTNDSPFGERTFDGGRDCSAIPNVNTVTCNAGKCLIESCRDGYSLSADGLSCISSFNIQAKKRRAGRLYKAI
ncbi:hypothetical protein L226DRAFT_488160 [Lentinus tigrinus ALCF2SS1-7]|uniref:Tyrosine-protein kinase ephrin type A/B receptor-like domain-containing protein n=1 Tax=Lentinus tigrinus ALCF2SS1-6 TaxID=1328759 RepID=A0A5C2RYP9_9APHY|nr:hypothetical protein L227DRAFT_287710 [Lentinus tigrinus ALCF2SS1-6]RPD73981.1 hypothetical protein L226DRAFT_488160 [Lentinus tigrinus ALCF2SS1-7]